MEKIFCINCTFCFKELYLICYHAGKLHVQQRSLYSTRNFIFIDFVINLPSFILPTSKKLFILPFIFIFLYILLNLMFIVFFSFKLSKKVYKFNKMWNKSFPTNLLKILTSSGLAFVIFQLFFYKIIEHEFTEFKDRHCR